MKYSINSSIVNLNKDILSEESLNAMHKEINSSYESCSKAMEAYNLISNVKAMESFGYIATESIGTYIKKGLKFIWEKIKVLFKKIGDFFIFIFKRVKALFLKQPKKNTQFVGQIASKAILALPEPNYNTEKFARLLLEAPQVKAAKEEIARAKASNELGAAAEKIGGVTKIAQNNFYVAGLIGYEPEQVVKICTQSAYPETDGTSEKKDFIDEYRKAVNLVYDERVRGEAINVAVLANHAIKQAAQQRTDANFRGMTNYDAINKIVTDTIEPAIEKYERPYQKVEGVRNAKAEFKKVCDMAANGGFDKIDAEENVILGNLKNFQNKLDETIVLFDDLADHDAMNDDRNDNRLKARLDPSSNMNTLLNQLKSNLSTDMKYFNLSIRSLKRIIDAKVGIAMIISKLSSTVQYNGQAAA